MYLKLLWGSAMMYIKHLAHSECPGKGSYYYCHHTDCPSSLCRWKLHNDMTTERALAKNILFSFWKFSKSNKKLITRAKTHKVHTLWSFLNPGSCVSAGKPEIIYWQENGLSAHVIQLLIPKLSNINYTDDKIFMLII